MALVAVLAVAGALWFGRRLRGKVDGMIAFTAPPASVLIGVLPSSGSFRNTPWGSWLAP